VGHTLFLVLVFVGVLTSTVDLRWLQEAVVDRPAFDLWWWLQNRFPHEFGSIVSPVLVTIGLKASSILLWFLWCLVVGGLPFFLMGYALGQFRGRRRKSRLLPT
jgi:hypothetical protein